MKPIIPIGLASFLFAGACYPVSPVCGFYGGLFAEVSYVPDIQVFLPSITRSPVEISYKIMGGGGGQLGYRISNNFRVEVEGLFNTNKFDELQYNNIIIPRNNSNDTTIPLSMSGSTNIIAGFFNAYYDILTPNTDCNFAPYLGLGIGYIGFENDLTLYQYGIALNPHKHSTTETEPGAQGIIGFSYFLDDFTWASMDYRYISTNKINALNDKRYELHTLNFSINFSFDGIMS